MAMDTTKMFWTSEETELLIDIVSGNNAWLGSSLSTKTRSADKNTFWEEPCQQYVFTLNFLIYFYIIFFSR